MPKIKIILGGQNHHDPLPIHLATEQIQAFQAQGLQISLGFEMAKDLTTVKFIEQTKDDILFSSEIKRLKDLLTENEGELTTKQRDQFLKSCKHQKVRYNFDRICFEIITDTINPGILADLELDKIKLKLCEIAQKLGIPIFGIEHDHKTREEIRHDLFGDHLETKEEFEANLAKWEPIRMAEMSKNIVAQVLKLVGIKNGRNGIIYIANLGAAHSQRLAVYLLKQFEKLKLPEDVEIEIVPTRIFGPSICDLTTQELAIREELFAKAVQLDPKEISECYPYVPCFELEQREEPSEDSLSEKFAKLMRGFGSQGFVYPRDYKAMKMELASQHIAQVMELASQHEAQVEEVSREHLLSSGSIFDASQRLIQAIHLRMVQQELEPCYAANAVVETKTLAESEALDVSETVAVVSQPLLFRPISVLSKSHSSPSHGVIAQSADPALANLIPPLPDFYATSSDGSKALDKAIVSKDERVMG